MANSTRLTIPFVTTGQNGGEVTHNEAMNYMDAFVGMNIISFGLNTPPGSPSDGDAYVIGGSPTGIWATKANQIAFYYSGWTYVVVVDGIILYGTATDTVMVKHASGWKTYGQQSTTIASIGALTAVSGTGDDGQVNANIDAIQVKVDAVIAAMKVANLMA